MRNGPATVNTASSEAAGVEVGGEIHRIAILTIRLDPCACYLARRLRESGAKIFLVNQLRRTVEPDSLAFFQRLWSRRGFRIALDYFLLFLAKRSVGAVVRLGKVVVGLARGRRAPAEAATTTALQPDPQIVDEDWLHYLEVENVNRSPGIDRLRSLEPDLILLAGAPILSRRTIEVARLACINPHCGITPDYAGSSPLEWPLYEGRYDDIGYTVHLVVPKVDSGPVLWQERVPWDPRKPLRHLSAILTQRMYDKLAEIVLEMVRGKHYVATPQEGTPVKAPAGLFVRVGAELRRMRYARRRRGGDA